MIIDCLSKAIFLFAIYNAIAIMLFGIPQSLSATHNLFKEKEDILKHLLPSIYVLLSIFIMPCMMNCTAQPNLHILAFVAGVSITAVGLVNLFESPHITNTIKNIVTLISVLFMLLWIAIVTPYWYVIAISFIIISCLAVITKTWKSSWIYWIEVMSFISIFVTVILYYFNYIKL